MDQKDKQILDLIKGNARMSYQENGQALGITRVALMLCPRRKE